MCLFMVYSIEVGHTGAPTSIPSHNGGVTCNVLDLGVAGEASLETQIPKATAA